MALRVRTVRHYQQTEVRPCGERTLRTDRELEAAVGWNRGIGAHLRARCCRVVRLKEGDVRGERARSRIEDGHFAREARGLRRHRKHDRRANARGRLRNCAACKKTGNPETREGNSSL